VLLLVVDNLTYAIPLPVIILQYLLYEYQVVWQAGRIFDAFVHW
jgi:hypothetical protein